MGQFVGQRRGELGRDRRIGSAQRLHGLRKLGGKLRKLFQLGRKVRSRGDAVAHGGEVARAAAADHQPRQRAGKIGRGLEALPYFRARPGAGHEKCDGVMPASDGAGIGERRGQPLREQSRARRRHAAVDRGEQRSAALARQGAHQLEVAARRLVDQERRALRLAHRRRERRALAELRALHIGDAGGGGGKLEPRERAEPFGGGQPEIPGEPPFGAGAIEHVAGERRHRRQRAQIGRELGVAVERVRHDDLARLEPGDVGGNRGTVALGNAEFAGRDIDPGDREAAFLAGGRARAGDREQVVVAPRIEQGVLGERARGDETDHVASHHALAAALTRFGRIFELLADRHAVAHCDQAVEVFVGTMDRHAAHRDVAAEMLAALGEHNAERAGRDFGVLEEQFVEIAHPVEQQAIRIGGFDLDILLHDRRGAWRAVRGGRTGFETGRGQGARSIHGAATLADGVAGFMRVRGHSHSECDRTGFGARARPI